MKDTFRKYRHAYLAAGVFAALVLGSVPALAGEAPLDVKNWLLRPGVRMLAVEFYAPWCKPCRQAEPKWEALHAKYRSRGLRVVVVIAPTEGSCDSLAWTPDKVYCDYGNKIAGQLKIDELPQAFLWSWQGDSLVGPGTVADVVTQVEKYFQEAPRILVSKPTDGKGGTAKGAESLRRLVRAELGRMGKFELVAGKNQEEELRRLRKEGYDPQKSAEGRCKLGREVSPNTRLDVLHEVAGDREMLILELFSIENGCQIGSATAPVLSSDLDGAVIDAVGQLVWALGGAAVVPGSSHYGGIQDVDVGQAGEKWQMDASKRTVVRFESSPAGAAVLVGGRLVCPQTPCSRAIALGINSVEMQMEKYLPATRNVKLEKDMGPILWTLEPDFAWVTVRTAPSGLRIAIDGNDVGVSPLSKLEIAVGPHVVLVRDQSYFEQGKKIQVVRGEHKELDLAAKPRLGGLRIDARDRTGNDIIATVIVDGKELGATPFSREVIIGKRKVVLNYGKKRWSQVVEVLEHQVSEVVASLAVGSTSVTRERSKGGKTAGWVFLGSTVVFGAVGGVLWWSGTDDMDKVAAGREGDMDQAAARELEDKANLKETLAIASWVISGVSLAGTIVAFAASPKGKQDSKKASYLPTYAPTSGGGMVSWGGTF